MPDGQLPVWAALSDATLEKRLRQYLWQSKMGVLVYAGRLGQLIAEAERRGKPEIVESAQKWVARSKTAPLL